MMAWSLFANHHPRRAEFPRRVEAAGSVCLECGSLLPLSLRPACWAWRLASGGYVWRRGKGERAGRRGLAFWCLSRQSGSKLPHSKNHSLRIAHPNLIDRTPNQKPQTVTPAVCATRSSNGSPRKRSADGESGFHPHIVGPIDRLPHVDMRRALFEGVVVGHEHGSHGGSMGGNQQVHVRQQLADSFQRGAGLGVCPRSGGVPRQDVNLGQEQLNSSLRCRRELPSGEAEADLRLGHHRDANVVIDAHPFELAAGVPGLALDDVAHGVRVEEVNHTVSRSWGRLRSRSARRSSGTPARSSAANTSLQFAGLRDRITSPVRGSRSMKTSLVSKRNAAGRRTAWLRPLAKTLAFCRTIDPPSLGIYIMIYSTALNVKQVARTTGFVVRVFSLTIIPAVSHSSW